MAFPVIQTADTQSGSVTSNDSTWDLTYPTNLASGDLILALLSTDGDSQGTAGATWPSGWNRAARYVSEVSAASIHIAAKTSDGTESGTFTVTLDGAEQGVWRIHRITGWFGEPWADGNSGPIPGAINGNGLAISAVARGTDTAPNATSLNPTNWDVEDTLWIAFAGSDHGNTTYTGFPTNYDAYADVAQESGGATGAAMGIAYRENAVASEDPSAFTTDASEQWQAVVIAIRPTAPAAPGPSGAQPRKSQRALLRRRM